VLTLSDGKQIILDNTGKGEIAQQGNARVIKSDNGQLVYQLSGNDHSGGKPLMNTVTTPRGKQFSVVLPDGSKVYLNSASSISYPAAFTGNERRVTVSGEFWFEITKDKSKPFRVAINSSAAGKVIGEVEVLGTHFNLNAYEDEAAIKTTLVEGLVKVSANGKNAFIKPGQQAAFSPAGNTEIKIINDADIDQVTAWKNGMFLFKKDDIETIMRQISRWYGAEVVYQDKIPGHFGVTLSRNQPVSKILEKLALTKDVQFEIDGNKIIVKK
jgi:ferric-dicitrate binding protein FerR (iron transport regulator)